MSTATETCSCGASITVTVRDGLVLGFRLAEWRKEHKHDDEVTRLRNWKAEALAVLAEWDGVYEALGSPATLGERKSTASFREVMRLREREARVRALIDEWDDDGDCALLYGGDAARKIRAALEGERNAHPSALDKMTDRAERAEAAIARVRARCEYVDILDASEYDAGRMAALDAVLAALDGGESA